MAGGSAVPVPVSALADAGISPGQPGQPVGVFADEHRNPCRHGLAAPFGQAGQELLPGRQGDCQR